MKKVIIKNKVSFKYNGELVKLVPSPEPQEFADEFADKIVEFGEGVYYVEPEIPQVKTVISVPTVEPIKEPIKQQEDKKEIKKEAKKEPTKDFKKIVQQSQKSDLTGFSKN